METSNRNQPKALTLTNQLHRLIDKHGLLEVCDRLVEGCHYQSELEEDSALKPIWTDLVRALEAATEAVSQLTAAKESQEKELWK